MEIQGTDIFADEDEFSPGDAVNDKKKDDDDDEISLIDLFAVLLRYKKLIICTTLIAAVAVVVFSIISIKLPPDKSPLPNEYTPAAHMLINNSSSQSGGMASMLNSSGLGSLASMAGVNLSTGSSFSDFALYMISANPMLDAITDKFGIIKRYEIEEFPRASARKLLKEKLKGSYEDTSGVFTISFTDTDPEFAKDIVNFCVQFLEQRFAVLGFDKNRIQRDNLEKNIETTQREIEQLAQDARNLDVYGPASGDFALQSTRIQMEQQVQQQLYTQYRVQYELIRSQMNAESPVFQVLEMAEVPEMKSGPSRGMLCVIVTAAAFFLSVFLAFVLNAVKNVRNDPVAMAKLREKN